jgi:hypothetical protein
VDLRTAIELVRHLSAGPVATETLAGWTTMLEIWMWDPVGPA